MPEPTTPDATPTSWFGEYLRHSRLPLASFAFVLPLVVIYEGGVALMDGDAVRNGAELWLRVSLGTLGWEHRLLLPALTLGLLLAAQHASARPWRFAPSVLSGMLLECLAWGAGLVAGAQLYGMLVAVLLTAPPPVAACTWAGGSLGGVVAFAGAGIYEEVLFRLALLPMIAAIGVALGQTPTASRVSAVVLSSLLFAVAHHVGPHGESLHVAVFLFRFAAGGFFACVFLRRGFGVAAGAHAAYDIMVGV